MTNDLPSVGTEDAPSMANYTFTIVADSGYESTTEGRCSAKQYGAAIYALHNDASYVEQRDSLAAERDELASRVRELTDDRDSWRDQCSQRVADWAAEHERVRELEGERERLTLSRIDRECLRIGQEIQRAAGELPDGYEIEVEVERGSGSVYLSKPDYSKVSFHDMVDGMSYAITEAIDAALNASKEQL